MEIQEQWYARAREMSLDSLPEFLAELAQYGHDYDTICHALAAGAVATCWALNRTPNGGITGFQAGAVMWEFMRAWNHIEAPAWLLRGKHLLYPQYQDKFTSITAETWQWVQDRVTEQLVKPSVCLEPPQVYPAVLEHWKSIRDGHVPFGLTVR